MIFDRSSRLASIVGASALALVLLSGCSAGSPDAGNEGPDSSTTEQTPAASGDFCDTFAANGGTGATIGPVLTFATKEEIVPDVRERLDAMGDLEPPAEIAAEWGLMKQYYTDLLAAAEALPDGANLAGSPEYDSLAEAPDEYHAVSDYILDAC